jgi:eukaryotic translation initiation factor 2C
MEQILPFCLGTSGTIPQDSFTVLNIVLAQYGSQHYTSVYRGLYSQEFHKSLGGGVEAWKGFKMSVRPCKERPLLNMNSTATTFFKSGPMMEVIADLLRAPGGDFSRIRSWGNRERQTVARALKNVKVQVNFRGSMRRKYRFNNLLDTTAKTTTFDVEKDGNIEK